MDFDLEQLRLELEKCRWDTGTLRRNMATEKYNKKMISTTFGLTTRGRLNPSNRYREKAPYSHYYWTTSYTRNKHLVPIFNAIAEKYFPDHKWTCIQINKNYPIKPHKDHGNKGESIIVGFGAYSGGELVVEDKEEPSVYDIKNTFLKFNGSEYTHYVRPFEGERWSLVFYSPLEADEIIKKN